MILLRRFWYAHFFYRIPRRWRIVGYVNLRERLFIGPFGIIYQTYSFHRFDKPVLGNRETFVGVRILDK